MLFMLTDFKLLVNNIENQDELKSRAKQNFLLFHKIKEERVQTEQFVVDVITKLQIKIFQFDGNFIDKYYHLGTKSSNKVRPILVQFVLYSKRKLIWESKIMLKNTVIYVIDYLTEYKQKNYNSAKEFSVISNVWSSEGHVIVKIANIRKSQKNSESDLHILHGKSIENIKSTQKA